MFGTLSAVAGAGDLEVRVSHADGSAPVPGAGVCIGTAADPRQLGALLTPADGRVVFRDVPHTSLVLTVSKPGFRGHRRVLAPADFDRVLALVLPRGGLGPICEATTVYRGPSLGERSSGTPGTPAVQRFAIRRVPSAADSRTVMLEFELRGHATEYRASENADLEDATWLPIEKSIEFKLSPGPGRKTVFFQVRRIRQVSGASLEVTSNIVSDSVTAQ